MKDLTQDIVREFLNYDPDSGMLTWRKRAEHWFSRPRICGMWNTRYAGKIAGRVVEKPNGYQSRVVRLFGHPRLEHRVIWLYMLGDSLPVEIDHINHNATDNRWSNLRASDRGRNSRNSSMKHNNTSGITGVSWHKQSGKWRARCWSDGKRESLGYFDNLKEAGDALAEFRKRNGYDKCHGKEKAYYRNSCAQ